MTPLLHLPWGSCTELKQSNQPNKLTATAVTRHPSSCFYISYFPAAATTQTNVYSIPTWTVINDTGSGLWLSGHLGKVFTNLYEILKEVLASVKVSQLVHQFSSITLNIELNFTGWWYNYSHETLSGTAHDVQCYSRNGSSLIWVIIHTNNLKNKFPNT